MQREPCQLPCASCCAHRSVSPHANSRIAVLQDTPAACPLSFKWLQSRYNACIVTSLPPNQHYLLQYIAVYCNTKPSLSSLLVTIRPSVLRHTFLNSQLLHKPNQHVAIQYRVLQYTSPTAHLRPPCHDTVVSCNTPTSQLSPYYVTIQSHNTNWVVANF